jgi:hypothetical protein
LAITRSIGWSRKRKEPEDKTVLANHEGRSRERFQLRGAGVEQIAGPRADQVALRCSAVDSPANLRCLPLARHREAFRRAQRVRHCRNSQNTRERQIARGNYQLVAPVFSAIPTSPLSIGPAINQGRGITNRTCAAALHTRRTLLGGPHAR